LNTLHWGNQSVQLFTAHYDKKLCTVHILNTTETIISTNSNVIIAVLSYAVVFKF